MNGEIVGAGRSESGCRWSSHRQSGGRGGTGQLLESIHFWSVSGGWRLNVAIGNLTFVAEHSIQLVGRLRADHFDDAAAVKRAQSITCAREQPLSTATNVRLVGTKGEGKFKTMIRCEVIYAGTRSFSLDGDRKAKTMLSFGIPRLINSSLIPRSIPSYSIWTCSSRKIT